MKRLLYLGLAAVMLPALVACNGARTRTVQIDWQDDDIVAVAFLGYYDSFGDFAASPSYLQLTRSFPQIVEAEQVMCGIGREIYLVVPRDPSATLAVNEAGEYVTDGNRRVFCRREGGRPVLLLNNWYEDNSQLVCTDNSGRTVSYVPAIDDVSGKLRPCSGVRDISLPLPRPMADYTSFDYGEDFDGHDLGISVRLQAGQPVLSCSGAPLTRIGIQEDAYVLSDGDHVFYGINGLCKGVYLGTIGQDYNPVVCVVMANGDVKMCSVFYAVQHGGPDLSAALPGFKDVTGFESAGGGEWTDEDGNTFYEYETIYALDERGVRTEIPCFTDYGTYRASDERYNYEVTLSPDWNYYVTCIDLDDYSPHEMYAGSFAMKEWTETECKFEFRRQHRMWAGDEDFKYDYTPVSGSFTAIREGNGIRVNLAGSDVFKSGTEFRDEMNRSLENDVDYD